MQNIFVVFGLTLLTSCASILSDSTYPVTFDSNPSGAEVTIRDESGAAVYKGTTPTTLTLSASDGFFDAASYTIEATLAGHSPARATLNAELDGWYLGNILFGGLLGILIIDPATGAMWRLVSRVTLNLSAAAVGAAAAPPGFGSLNEVRVVSLADVPAELRPLMQPIPAFAGR